jgi:acetylornithine/N-succinyldiaminopimelate aminotransferase
VRERGRILEHGLRELCALRVVSDVRGVGMMWGIELESVAAPVVARALDAGLILTTAGERVIRLLPPLVITESEINEGLSVLREVLS